MPENNFLSAAELMPLLKQHKRTIGYITLLAAIAGALFYLIVPSKYEAQAYLILKNPLYGDRNFVYNNETKFIDYFASDDDIDRFITMSESDSLQNYVIRTMHLASVYNYDTTDREDVYKLKRKFSKQLKIFRTDKKIISLSYTDKDPDRAAAVANLCATAVEHLLHGFYSDMRMNMYQSITNKVHDEDSSINLLTDSLAALREKYGVYDIISPSRNNIIMSEVKNTGQKEFAKGLEQIQNLESLKDELVTDRAKHVTLANQYATGLRMNETPLISVVQNAKPPVKPIGMNIVMMVIVSAVLGFFFSLLYVLLSQFVKKMR